MLFKCAIIFAALRQLAEFVLFLPSKKEKPALI